MSDKYFYKADEKHVSISGEIVTLKDILYFKFFRAGKGGAAGVDFDNKATKEHVSQYADAYHAFKELNPDYKLPWGLDEDLVGKPVQPLGHVVAVKQLDDKPPVVEDLPKLIADAKVDSEEYSKSKKK